MEDNTFFLSFSFPFPDLLLTLIVVPRALVTYQSHHLTTPRSHTTLPLDHRYKLYWCEVREESDSETATDQAYDYFEVHIILTWA